MKTPLSRLPIRLKRNPGQPGTKKLLSKYGQALVCVRYRYDRQNGKRYKTVELVIAAVHWKPGQRHRASDLVWVQVAFEEIELRARIKAAGGLWSPQRQLWQLRYDKAKSLRLLARMMR